MPSSPSSEFDFELDDDDIRQLDLAEQAAISQQQPTPSTSSISVPSITQSPKTPTRSPTFVRPTITTPTVSPVHTLPWQKSPITVRSQTIPPSTGAGLAVKGRARPLEPPTHHQIDRIAAKTWIYPTNKTFRDYQFNIVQRALFDNVLVSLPTGLGKTFIAAVVMYNFYRWFPKSKIVFVAPTRPLVAQQVDACFHICGVPYSATAELTGTNQLAVREMAYAERRVFYMTPQTLANDLKRGAIDAKDIVCLVIDEAHRATGKYAYGECVTLIRKENQSFRVLALSATPGSSIEAVQNVIDSCSIARVEIRIETSLDLAPFLHKRKNEVIVVPLGDEITELRELLVKVLSKFLDKVKGLNDYRLRDPYNITQFQVNEARKAMFASSRGANQAVLGMMNANLAIIGALGQAMGLLVFHGIQPFYEKLGDLQSEHETKSGQTSKTLIKDENFQELMTRVKILTDNPNTVGHPKIERAAGMIIHHFLTKADEGVDTRVMVFVQYRSSASVLVKQLKRQEPLIKPQLFVGQATDSRGGTGMKQKEQKEVVQQFKDGKYNVLVATSIGEEGLDIGDVDLIISYDASASPVRMLQRSGRTGRKREGHVVFLVTEGKEQRDHAKSLDAYNVIQKKIASGKDFTFRPDESPRILPAEITPDVVKMDIRAPDEDKTALELQVDRRKRTKRKERDWSLPEDVEAGFVSAKELAKRGENATSRKAKGKKRDVLGTPSPGRRLLSRNPNISPRSPDAISRVYDEIPSSSESELGDLSTELAAFAERRKASKGKEVAKSKEVVQAKVVDRFEMDVPLSSMSEIGDLMTELQKAKKGREVILVDSDEDDYGLPSEFERSSQTPRKRIKIEDFGDED